jgi:hypothetical protein
MSISVCIRASGAPLQQSVMRLVAIRPAGEHEDLCQNKPPRTTCRSSSPDPQPLRDPSPDPSTTGKARRLSRKCNR